MTMNGWAGTILRVDLTQGTIRKEPLIMDWARQFIGGRGLNSRTLYREIAPGTSPLSPENPLIIGVGPCNGTLVPGSGSLTITTRSPLSGFLGDASTRAIFGARLKYAGYDQIIIQGKAKKPVYLWIDDDRVEIRDASHLWGKLVGDTIRLLKQENRDPDIGVLCIGPAGENKVKFAAIMGESGRSAGRTGVGTVMGYKNLKALAVRGTGDVRVHDPAMLEDVYREVRRFWLDERREIYERRKIYGLTQQLWTFQESGFLSTKNYRQGTFEKFAKLDPRRLAKHYLGKSRNCFGCFLPCDKNWVITKGRYAGTHGSGLELAQVHHTASRMGISDPDVFFYLDTMLDEYGLDIMDWAGVTGLAIECYLDGLITTRDTGGLRLDWGAKQAIVKLLDMIVYRQGFGDILAEGVKRAAEIIGQGAEKYALHVKGLTPDAMDPRGAKGWGLGYATSSRGAEHCRTISPDREPGIDRFAEKDKPAIVKWCQECRAVQHCLEVCFFCWPAYDSRVPDQLARIFAAVTGIETSGEQMMLAGQRLTTLERCFNIREGLCKSDDSLPDRFTKEMLPAGASQGQVVNLEPMLDKYYELNGWDVKSGFPKKTTLESLGLKEMANDVEAFRQF